MARLTARLFRMGTPLRVALGGLIGLLVGSLLLLARPTQVIETVELRFVDARTRHFVGQRHPDERIVVAEILEEDVDDVRRAWGDEWPWELRYNAYMFDVMRAAGVRAVVVDVLHLDQGAGVDDVGLDHAPSDQDVVRYEHQAAMGRMFGTVLGDLGRVALAFELVPTATYEVPARATAARTRLGGGDLEGAPRGLVRPGANLPVRRVLEGATLLGFVNVVADADGVVRRSYVVGRWGDTPVPSLPFAGAVLAAGSSPYFDSGGAGVSVGPAYQPLMGDGSFLVDFRGLPGATYPRVSPSQLLAWAAEALDDDERVDPAKLPAAARKALEGKIVVWGVNLAGRQDMITTSLGGGFHGPEYHAAAIDCLLWGDGRVRASFGLNATILLLLTVGLGVTEGVLRNRLLPHVVPFLLAASFVVFATWAFGRGTSLDVFTPLLGITLTWGVTSIVRSLTEGRQRRWLEGVFGKYLAPSIIDALKRNPDLLALGGRRKDLTVLFSDVAAFTKISERLEADQVVDLLNRYLTLHSAAVMEEGGVVDKFEGDAVMAFFGDPVPTEEMALQGCRAALAVIDRLPSLRPVWEEKGLDDFRIRIGLNTGSVIVGNMGSSQRFDYTCMGDPVNLASRLEGANKAFGSTIMIGSRTRADAGDAVVVKPLADLVVVGRSVPEPVFELLALRATASEDVVRHAEAFAEAQAAARRGDLHAAKAALDEAEAYRPGDPPVDWFRGVVARMESGEEPTPWSGRVELTSK